MADVGTGGPLAPDLGIGELDLGGGKTRFAVLDVGVALGGRGVLDLHGDLGALVFGITRGVALMQKLLAFELRMAEVTQSVDFQRLGFRDLEFGLGLKHGLEIIGVVELGDEVAFLDLVADVELQGNEPGGNLRVDVERAPRLRRAGVNAFIQHGDAFRAHHVHDDGVFRFLLRFTLLFLDRLLITLPGEHGDGRKRDNQDQQDDFFSHISNFLQMVWFYF